MQEKKRVEADLEAQERILGFVQHEVKNVRTHLDCFGFLLTLRAGLAATKHHYWHR